MLAAADLTAPVGVLGRILGLLWNRTPLKHNPFELKFWLDERLREISAKRNSSATLLNTCQPNPAGLIPARPTRTGS